MRTRRDSLVRRGRRAFRDWRRRRPFWGGLLAMLSGAEIAALPLAPASVMFVQGPAGITSVLMGVFLVALGLITWSAPGQRTIAGVLTVLVGLGALVLSNLGGFVIGTLLALLGGGLMFAWQPTPRRRRTRRGKRRSTPESRPEPEREEKPAEEPSPTTGTLPPASSMNQG